MSQHYSNTNPLVAAFGYEYLRLTPEHKRLIDADFAEMVEEEFAGLAHDAAIEYRRRIRPTSLWAYAKALVVGVQRLDTRK